MTFASHNAASSLSPAIQRLDMFSLCSREPLPGGRVGMGQPSLCTAGLGILNQRTLKLAPNSLVRVIGLSLGYLFLLPAIACFYRQVVPRCIVMFGYQSHIILTMG